jgi:uncharacterized protein
LKSNKGLIIFIKNPQLGKVKTRLAKTVGDEKALEIYQNLLDITRQNALILRGGVDCHLFYSDFIDLNDEWDNTFFIKNIQRGNDLGEKMYYAFKKLYKKYTQICIIGSDCPTLSADIMLQAFSSLDTSDFVFGPSTDGGYYLLGMQTQGNTPPQYIFKNIEWSTETVLPISLDRIQENQKSVSLLTPLTDIDEEKDWVDFMKNNT